MDYFTNDEEKDGSRSFVFTEDAKEKKIDSAVLRVADVQRKLMKTICQRQLDFFCLAMSRNGLENLVGSGNRGERATRIEEHV